MSIKLDPVDAEHLRAAAAATLARAGELPFAARRVDGGGHLIAEAVNEVQLTGDPTAHAEIVLLRRAGPLVDREVMAGMTVHTAAEPCAMCAAALVFSGVGRIVYGMSAEVLAAQVTLGPGLVLPGVTGRALLDATPNGPRVIGPALEDEAQKQIFPA